MMKWGLSSGTPADSYYEVRSDCTDDVPKSKFKIKAGKTLSARKWHAAFSPDGCLDIASVLSRIQRGGVHPTVRGEVWEFLLGCFDPRSTFDEREEIRQIRRLQYARWKEDCREMDSHVGSGKIITAPLITEDGRPIKDPLVLLEATADKNDSEGAPATSRNNGIEIDETAERITDKQIIEWKLTLHQIGLDVLRTDRTMVFYENKENLSKLWDILAVYAWIDKDVGYCQGMSDLCSPMIVLLNDEADAFWCFEKLMRRLLSVGSDIAHYLMGRHDDTPMIDKETHRLAVVNMDWDHIKAVDLYMVMTSCLPKGGRVLSVSIYPSEFGLKCMEIESTQGPAALVNANVDDNKDSDDNEDDKDDDKANSDDDDDEDNTDDDDEEVDSDKENNKLRAYELNRLKYYYAVVVCDSSATANHLYMALDGTEFLKTANVFDLQFIPDSREFKHPARDVATEAPPSYKEPDFETRALQHSRVKLTWDDDEPERKKVLRRKFTDDQLDELNMYLASDDSASDEDGVDSSDDESLPNGGSKRKLTKEERLAILLQGDKSDEEQTDDQDMEITFNTELEDLSKRILERKSNEEKTVWEKHQEKMKEKRKARKRGLDDNDDHSSEDEPDEDDDFFANEQSDEEPKPSKSKKHKSKAKDKGKRKGKDGHTEEHLEREATREELELLVAGDQDTASGAKGYNLKRKKGKKGKEEPAEDKLPDIDLSKDDRFSAMFTSHLFALDPTDPQYKRSAAFMQKQTGKPGANASKAEGSSLGGTLPPDDAAAKNNDDQKPDGASTEKLQILSAVKSLKRNLGAFKSASTGGR